MPESVPQPPAENLAARRGFLADGGEMGALTRAFDWSTTVLGPAASWPQSLRTAVSIILSAKAPMFLWWGADLIQFYNDAYRPSLGNAGKHPAALGQRGADCWPEIWPTIHPLIAQVRAGGAATWNEDQLIPIYRNGQLEDVYWTFGYSPVNDECGHVGGVLVVCTETTAKVLAHQQQQEQQARLHGLFEQAPVAFAVLRGPRHVVELANPAVCAVWGRTPAQSLHRSLLDVLPELAGQGIQELLDGVMATGVPYANPELRVDLDRHGRRDAVYFNVIYQPLHGPDGGIDGVTVIASDVSEQVQARQQVQALNEELAVANQLLRARNDELGDTNQQLTRTNGDLDTFIYTASHDLKQPIANIEGLLEALGEHLPAETHLDPLVPRLLGMMQQDVERFQRTIHQLTNLTRLQQVHDAPAEAVDLAAVVEAVRLDLAPLLAGAQLTVTVPPGLHIHFSPHNLRSVVYNLLSNAVKYRHPDRPPVVQLRAYVADQTAVLEVQDNGLGLDATQQAQLFGLFRRLHTHVEGSGMGLYIVKRLVENAGGTIAVHSQAGAGATFTVTFPA